MTSPAHTARERGLALVSRANRWLIAGAVAASGLISVAAANAFHGRTRGTGAARTATGRVSTKASTGARTGTASLKPPAQAPAPAASSGGGGVVSGGS
jgi:hypothetical protein